MTGNEFRQTIPQNLPPEGIERVADADPVGQIMQTLEVGAEDAGYVASINVKCPVKGPNGETIEMPLGDFIATPHGREHGAETLALARRELQRGEDVQTAIDRALGSQAVRDKEGELTTADSRPEQADAAKSEAEKK